MPRLKRVDCSGPGIQRRRRGKGFEYLGVDGRRIDDPETLARIRTLAIPPAWEAVWICRHANGHLQAVGVDAAGRKQYLYHERWRTRRDQKKFDHMLEFARALPVIRSVTSELLDQPGYGRDKILACATRLLDRGFFRIGTEGYAEQNQTYGLATIHKRHVTVEDEVITFDYIAKSGTRRITSLVDPAVHDVIATLKKRRSGGPELLAYKDGRAWRDIKSADINDFVRQISGAEYTAKDFRTWNATVLAAVALGVSGGAAQSDAARRRAITRATKEVAHYLGNTPAVCRASYIDPRVFDRYRSGWTISTDRVGEGAEFGDPATQGPIEQAVIDLIEDRRQSPELERIA
jgi:DNA topoisomerase I